MNGKLIFYLCAGVSATVMVIICRMSTPIVIVEPFVIPSDVDNLIERDFLVYSNACVIPMLYPFPSNLRNLIHVRKHVECKGSTYITYRDGYTIKVNKSVTSQRFPGFRMCEYTPFIKRENYSIRSSKLLRRKKRFTKAIKVKDEFVTVECFNRNGKIIERQQYSFIIRNKTLDGIYDSRYSKATTRQPMNVLVLGFESTSRLNFVRHMNETYSYIMQDMKAVEMFGYNKFGLNTFPNMVGVFLGIPEIEMNYSRGFLDKYPFIWKNFSALGYRTFTTEDSVAISTFNYLKKGFRNSPMDHYMLPFMRVLEGTGRKGLCYGNKQIMEIMLEQLKEFISVYNDVPHFTYTMVSKQTHDNSDGLGVEDKPYLNMLKQLQRDNYLENTIIFFLGDHGIRYGRLRNTYQGRLEENLPALFIVPPPWFRKEHANLYKNLQSNSHKLTSNTDIFATFHDIINIGRGSVEYNYKGKYGKSLLRDIPTDRTCTELNIPSVYCSCGRYEKVNITEPMIANLSRWIVSRINNLLESVEHLCVKFRLGKIISSYRSAAKHLQSSSGGDIFDYIVKVTVTPSGGIFEAGVRYDTSLKTMKLVGQISRLDKYKGQSNCVKHSKNGVILERFCFCRRQQN